MSLSPAEIIALEMTSARAWPAARIAAIGGWRLYGADGYSGRINACWPLEDPLCQLRAAIGKVEAWYGEQGLPPRFKVVDGPCGPSDLTGRLSSLGYEPVTETMMMVGPASGTHDVDVKLGDSLDERFEQVFAATGAAPAETRERLDALARVPAPRAFAVLSADGAVAAIGAAAVEAEWCGLFAMRTSPGFRRRGLAARVVGGLLAWAGELGATRSWLQVEADNAGAIALYRRAGFVEAYRYRYWIRSGGPAETAAAPRQSLGWRADPPG